MIELIIGILIGIILFPILICLYPTISKINKRSTNTNLYFKKHLSESQAKVVLKSLNKCTDLHWVNVFLDRFWLELSESSAQAYRLKNFIKKSLQDFPGTGFIRSIEVLDIDIGQEGPQIESIRMISEHEIEDIVRSVLNKDKDIPSPEGTITSENDEKSDSLINFYKENGEIDCDKVYKELFTNVHSIFSIIFTGSIKIKLQVDFPKNITLYTNVCINKIKGDILTRFPSLNYNTRLEYTFIGNPDMEIEIEAGVGKGQNEGYFKKSISNFIRRTIKYTILKSFVYPSFNTLYLPLLVSSFKNAKHSISEVSIDNKTDTIKNMEKVKESLSLYMDMDYKIIETFNDITIRRNNFLINEKERIYCAHFVIPDCAFNSSHFTTNKNFIYEKLTIKESKIMNQIYDLSILKEVISSYKETTTLQNFNSTYSLIDIKFIDKSYKFLRLVHNDTIYFQKNDNENPEFFIFTIRNKELFIYYFINTPSFLINKNRLIKLKNKFEMKPGKKISFNKLYKFSKNALLFWKNNPYEDPKKLQVTDVKNIVEDVEYPNFLEEIDKILQEPIQQQKTFSYKFKCKSNIIFDILLQDDVRVKLISDQSKIFRFLSENELLKSFAVENKDEDGGDFVMHTLSKSNFIVDFIDTKKIIYELIEETNENIPELYVDTRIQNPLYKIPSISETQIKNCDKNKKIVFKNFDNYLTQQVKLKSNFQRIIEKYETKLNIYVEEGVIYTKDSHLYESVYTRITKQEIINIVNKSDFEKLDLKKELRKDFFGDIGGVYIEFKTDISDDFKFLLYSTSQKRNILEIHKVISSRPFKMIIPVYEEDILLLKLVPKYFNNKSIEIKVVNLPIEYHKETMIDCNIGLKKNESFLYPITGSPNYIIYWEKEKEDHIQGSIESPYTKVDICGNGTMRTDQMSYTMTYKNKGQKCRELKIYIGVTKKE